MGLIEAGCGGVKSQLRSLAEANLVEFGDEFGDSL